MQDETTLTELGFRKKPSLNDNEYLFRGKHQKFIAVVHNDSRPSYVSLYLVSPEIDKRPLSDHKGKHFKANIKDCCSNGSIERAVAKYDLPEDQIYRTGFTVIIKQQ